MPEGVPGAILIKKTTNYSLNLGFANSWILRKPGQYYYSIVRIYVEGHKSGYNIDTGKKTLIYSSKLNKKIKKWLQVYVQLNKQQK